MRSSRTLIKEGSKYLARSPHFASSLWPMGHSLQSVTRSPHTLSLQSVAHSPQSVARSPQSVARNPQPAICGPHTHSPQSVAHIPAARNLWPATRSPMYVGRGQRNKVMKYGGGGAPESPLSMGPERPRYATASNLIKNPGNLLKLHAV